MAEDYKIINGCCYSKQRGHWIRDELLGMALAGISLAENSPSLANNAYARAMEKDLENQLNITTTFSGPDLSKPLETLKRLQRQRRYQSRNKK